MKTFKVEFRSGVLYLKDSETALQFMEGAEFEIKISEKLLAPLPKEDGEEFNLQTGTHLGLRLPGTNIQVYVEILEPLIFIFTKGEKTKVDTKIRCRAYEMRMPKGLFPSELDFEPLEAESLHELYSVLSKKYKKSISHHNAHVINLFYVLKTNLLLAKYCESKNLFENDIPRTRRSNLK